MQKLDNKKPIRGITESQEVLVRQDKRAIRVLAIEVLLYIIIANKISFKPNVVFTSTWTLEFRPMARRIVVVVVLLFLRSR